MSLHAGRRVARASLAALLPLAATAPLGAQAFEPGPRALFEEDFTSGQLPKTLTVIGGDAAIGDEQGRKVLRVASSAVLDIALPERLPDRFTVEVDALVPWGYAHPIEIRVPMAGDPKVGFRVPDAVLKRAVVRCGSVGSGVVSAKFPTVVKQKWEESKGETACRVTVQDGRVQVHFGEKAISDQQPVDLGRGERLQIAIPAAGGGREAFVRRIRIGAYPPDLYGAIAKSGRVTADGIYFDTGSDRIRDESGPVLEQIAGMLREHPELRLVIEGHTDDVGNAAANAKLSEQRAAAVRAHLVEKLGVDSARLTSAGFGATRPVAPNTSAESRQKNRRVELVRQP